jgi:hypothetical protein
MTKRKKKLTPEQRMTVAGYHERAYGAGRFFAIHMLETIAGMERARAGDFEGIDRSRFQPDMYFIRGFLDATRPVFGDAGALMRSKFGLALQEAILDDFFDNAAFALQKIKSQSFDRMPSF